MNRKDLQDYKNETAYINQQLEDIEQRRNRLTKITPAYKETFGASFTQDKIGEGVAEMVDTENKLFEQLQERLEIRKNIYNSVNEMPNDRYQRTLLYFLYISERPLSLIEIYKREILPKAYDYRYLKKLKQRALNEYDERYDIDDKC